MTRPGRRSPRSSPALKSSTLKLGLAVLLAALAWAPLSAASVRDVPAGVPGLEVNPVPAAAAALPGLSAPTVPLLPAASALSLPAPALPPAVQAPAAEPAVAEPRRPEAPIAAAFDGSGEGLAALLSKAVESGELTRGLERKLWDAGYVDPLTGIPNRLYLEDHLPSLVSRHKSLITFKLDFLKEINDSHDHETGNTYLKAVVAVAGAVAGPEAVLVRRSPTGFALFLEAEPSRAVKTASALRAAADHLMGDPAALLGAAGGAHGGTINVGLSPIEAAGSPAASYRRAFERAEVARLAAKEAGGNRVAVPFAGDSGTGILEPESFASLRGPRAAGGLARRLARIESEGLPALMAGARPRARAVRASDLIARVRDEGLRARLDRLVYRDRLSGLPGRRWLFENLPRLFGPEGFDHYIALDLDRFSGVVAALGEDGGDLVLREFGQVLAERARGKDALALHLSGEEFVLLTRGGDPRALAEELRKSVQEELGPRVLARYGLGRPGGGPLDITVSLGIAAIKPLPGGPGPMLTLASAMAEAMLQRAKEGGRNRVESRGSSLSEAELLARLGRVIRVDANVRRAVRSLLKTAR